MKRSKTSRRWHRFLLVVVLLASYFTLSQFQSPAYAATAQCQWTSTDAISCGPNNYSNLKVAGNTAILTGQGGQGNCPPDSITVSAPYKSSKTAAIRHWNSIGNSHVGTCSGPVITKATLSNTWNDFGNPDASNTSSSPECTDSNDPLSWIICPVFQSVADMSDWLFNNIITPFLITTPINVNSSDPIYKVWSNFRLYGDIFLVIALLVIVFGQSIGGGLIDAYTVKKSLPRILIAAILINLSIYIVAFMIDITNIIGKSIGNILIEPFKNGNDWHFSPNAVQGIGVFAVGILGLLVTGGAIKTILDGMLDKKTGAKFSQVAIEFVFLVSIPILLSILAVFVTLIIRKGLILFLVLVSPVAFALYALPGTEKYFQKWWTLLLEALLVFPIIMIIFAIADILSITILNANNITRTSIASSSAGNVVAIIVALILQFLPLVLIPFAFRMAGGTLSKWHEVVANTHAKVGERSKHHAQEKKFEFEGMYLPKRKDVQSNAAKYADANKGTARGWAARRLAKSAGKIGGRPVDYAMAEHLQEVLKREQGLTNFGADDIPRGATANKEAALAGGKGARQYVQHNADGSVRTDARGNTMYDWYEWNRNETTGEWERGKQLTDIEASRKEFNVKADSSRTFRSLGGKQVAEWAVDEGHHRALGNQDLAQAYLHYEVGKATAAEEQQRVRQAFADNSIGKTLGLSDRAVGAAQIGAAYGQQQTDFDLKYADDRPGRVGFVTETHSVRGSYPMSQVKTEVINREIKAFQQSQAQERQAASEQARAEREGRGEDAKYWGRVVNEEQTQQQMSREIAATWSSRFAGGEGVAPAGADGEPTVVPMGGAGGVSKAMQDFVNVTKAGAGPPTGP